MDASGKRVAIHDGTQTTFTSGAVVPAALGTGGTRYSFDLAGRLVQESFVGGRTIVYSYDKVGNRKTRTETPSGQSGQVTSYDYDDNDRLTSETRPDGSVVSYGYDANGALVSESTSSGGVNVRRVLREFSFDGRASAQREFIPGSLMVPTAVTEYDYDGDGNRVGVERKTIDPSTGNVTGQTTSWFLVDTAQPYAEVVQEWEQVGAGGAINLVARYDLGLDRLRMVRGATASWYVFDGLGSTRALVDDSGSGSDLWEYGDAFGIPVRSSGSTVNAFFLNGQQFDGYEGLYFNRARYYQPNLGRFIGQDPWRESESRPITLHRYLYSGNDPINFIDPTGMQFSLSGILTTVNLIMTTFNATSGIISSFNEWKNGNYEGAIQQSALVGIDLGLALLGLKLPPGSSGLSTAVVNNGGVAALSRIGSLSPGEISRLARFLWGGVAGLWNISRLQLNIAMMAADGEGGSTPSPSDTRRTEAGTVTGGESLPTVSGQILKDGKIGYIPKQVAIKLRGRPFSSWQKFREALWIAMSDVPDIYNRFGPDSQRRLKLGLAPWADYSERTGGGPNAVLQLGHIIPLQHGGPQYDLDNILIMSPKYHVWYEDFINAWWAASQ